jgi:hypothetical protein
MIKQFSSPRVLPQKCGFRHGSGRPTSEGSLVRSQLRSRSSQAGWSTSCLSSTPAPGRSWADARLQRCVPPWFSVPWSRPSGPATMAGGAALPGGSRHLRQRRRVHVVRRLLHRQPEHAEQRGRDVQICPADSRSVGPACPHRCGRRSSRTATATGADHRQALTPGGLLDPRARQPATASPALPGGRPEGSGGGGSLTSR